MKYLFTCQSKSFKIRGFVFALLSAEILFITLSWDLALPIESSYSVSEKIIAALKTYGIINNIFTISMALFLYVWFVYFRKISKEQNMSDYIISGIFGLLNTCAYYLFYRNRFPELTICSQALFLIQTISWAFIFFVAVTGVKAFWTKNCCYDKPSNTKHSVFFKKNLSVVSFFVILLGWMPWLISYYPASMEWDVYDPILRFLGQWGRSNHHPWFYACVIGGSYKLGLTLGNKNIGVFLYTILRALFMAAIYSRCITKIWKYRKDQTLCILVLCFYAFTPIWGAYAKHAFKDTIGAALFCWYLLSLSEITKNVKIGRLSIYNCIEYSVSGLFLSLFRNNCIYIVIIITIFLSLVLLKKKINIGKLILILLCIICFYSWQYYIYNILNVDKSSVREALSIPFQQTARTVKYRDKEIAEADKASIRAVLDYDHLNELYDPIISDPVKDTFHGKERDLISYLKTWFKMFWHFPKEYLEAFIAHSSGYYTFTPEYTEEQRYGPGSHYNVGMTVFNWVKDPRFDDELTCDYNKNTESLRTLLDNWVKIWHQLPILNFTDIKPLYTWTIILVAIEFLKKKKFLEILPISALILMIFTCIISPVNDCFRYFCPVAAAFPTILTIDFTTSTKEGQG